MDPVADSMIFPYLQKLVDGLDWQSMCCEQLRGKMCCLRSQGLMTWMTLRDRTFSGGETWISCKD
jgi:hypothetical protein